MLQTLTTDQKVAIAHDFVNRVFNAQDPERARDFFTDDITFHALTVGTLSGIDTVVPVLASFIGALSDIHAEVQDVIASDDLVTLRVVVKARHTGTLLGMPPTNNPIQWDAADIYRIEHDALSRGESIDVVRQHPDDFMTRHERQRHQRGEVERGVAGDRREVRPADPRQHRPHARPPCSRRLRRLAVHQPERRDRSGEQAGQAAADRALRDEPWDRTVQLERERGHRDGSGTSNFGVPFAASHSSIGHPRERAMRVRATSGLTATGLPAASSIGRSDIESAYA